MGRATGLLRLGGQSRSMIRLRAPAKVNLFLEITGKRRDGYHTLSTVFQTISLADELTLAPAKTLTLTCSNPSLPTDESNLVMKAALRLQNALGETRGARIHLKKVVPMGAGLGGGSSDAASVLLGLQKLWKRTLLPARLAALATTLGADVPFFLKGGLCSATGIGEILKPLKPIRNTWMVLVFPGFGVPTKEAYGRVCLPYANPKSAAFTTKWLYKAPRQWAGHLFNRFEDSVFPAYPVLPILKQELLDAGADGALMSGSGASVFGVVTSAAKGRRILRQFRPRFPQSWLVHSTH